MSSHIGSLAGMKDEVDLVAICDCDDEKLATAEKRYRAIELVVQRQAIRRHLTLKPSL